VPLHDLKVEVWPAISVWTIIGPMFFQETNFEHYVRQILHPFLINWMMKKNCMGMLSKIMQWHILQTILWMHYMKSLANE
jgi:hypothetical protein